jgi:O-antigen/teichoic acid export membrane protein
MAVIAAFTLNAGLNFVLGLLVASLLGPADFGRFALGTAFAIAMNTVVFEWLRLATTRFYSGRTREGEPWVRASLERGYRWLGLGLAGAAALAALAGPYLWPQADTVHLIAAGGAAAIGIGVFDYHAALSRARFEGGLYFRLVLAKNVAAFALMTGTALAWPDPAAVLLAGGLSQFLAILLLRRGLADPPHALAHGQLRATARLFLAYGLPLAAANAVYQLMPFLNRAVIAQVADFSQAGYFSLAADVGTRVFSTVGSALDLLLFQIAVRTDEHHGRAAAEAQVARNLALVVAILLPCAAGLLAVTPAFEALVVPAAYRGHFGGYLGLLLPGLIALAFMNFTLNPIFQIRRRTAPVIGAALAGLAVNAAALGLLPGRYGAPGVALAQTLGLCAAFAVLCVRALTGPERLTLPRRDLGASLAATLAMTAAVWPTRAIASPSLALLVAVPLGALVYGGLAWRLDIAGLRGLVADRLRPPVPAA